MTASDDSQHTTRGHRLPGGRREHSGENAAAATEAMSRGSFGRVRTAETAQFAQGRPDVTQRLETGTDSTAQLPRDAQPQADRRIGRFELLEKVGEGGMGVVYRAFDPQNPGRDVALKVLRPHIAYDTDAQTRLAREVQTLERVHHPGVAAVVDADPWGERPYIATEFVPGVPLDKVIAQAGAFSPEQMAQLGRDLASAIDAIHRAGVVHRDLKPSNVLMVGDRPVVIDFGIAHIADDARLTSTGLVMGTPGYLSPELVEGAPVSRSTDWWGWAATLAFAAQGEPPFGRGPMPAVLDRVTRGQSNLQGVDERLRPLLSAALSPVPSERPSARQVIEQMERYAKGEPTTVVPMRQAAPPTAALPPRETTRRAPVTGRTDPAARPAAFTPGQRAVPQQRVPQPSQPAHPYGASPYQAPQRPVRPQSRPGEHDPRLQLPHRSGTLQALFLAWAALTGLAPVLGFVLLIAWNLAARFVDSTITQAVVRRYEAGRRRSDGAVAVASAPWHALRALLGTVTAFVLPLIVFAAVDCLVGIAWASLRGGVPTAFWSLPLVPAALAGQWAMWRGASSTTYRRGARSLVRGAVPSGTPTTVVVCVLIAIAGLAFLTMLGQQGSITWAPLTGGITDPLSEYLPNSGSPLR